MKKDSSAIEQSLLLYIDCLKDIINIKRQNLMDKYDVPVVAKKDISTKSGYRIKKGTEGKMSCLPDGSIVVSYPNGFKISSLLYPKKPYYEALYKKHWLEGYR